jgi:hypothetical protein
VPLVEHVRHVVLPNAYDRIAAATTCMVSSVAALRREFKECRSANFYVAEIYAKSMTARQAVDGVGRRR